MGNAATIPARCAGYTAATLHADCPMTPPVLSSLEARVLGVLVEKQRTVPDTYPLTLNALVAGCNQKTSRHPVMSATEAEVQATLDRLRADMWIVETSGGRVMRYAHNVERVLELPAQSVALLATLLLRGAQTAAELRVNCDRLHPFADVSAVEAFLHELAERPAGPLAVELPRAAGTREARWTERLSDTPAASLPASPAGSLAAVSLPAISAPGAVPAGASSPIAADAGRPLEALVGDVAELRRDVDRLTTAIAELRASLASCLRRPS